MNPNEIEQSAKALMTAHGVGHLSFKWSRSKRRIAACFHYTVMSGAGRLVKVPTEIQFSSNWASLMSPKEIHEVMLHEIAHALTPGEHHSEKWKRTARRIGATGDRCYTPENADLMPKAVVPYCPVCDKEWTGQHRLPLRVYWCADCMKAGRIDRKNPQLGQAFQWRKNGKRVYTQDMPARYRTEWEIIKESAR